MIFDSFNLKITNRNINRNHPSHKQIENEFLWILPLTELNFKILISSS